jgi:hypothetical protein
MHPPVVIQGYVFDSSNGAVDTLGAGFAPFGEEMKLPRGFTYLRSLFAKRRAHRVVRRALPHAEALVQAYGRALVEAAESGSLVTDVKYLPAPKDALKTALLLGHACGVKPLADKHDEGWLPQLV